MAKQPSVTVICPVFNEEKTIPLFFERINKVFDGLRDRFELSLLFVDNGSQDLTPAILRQLRSRFPFVYHIALSRNFGYQASVECGLRHAQGDLFVIIDVDCEDPPEMIPEFLRLWKDGYDVVYGERLDREEARLMILLRKAFYRIARLSADDFFVLDMAEFSLLTSEVRDAILEDNNSFPFIRSSIGRLGFHRKNIPYKRGRRVAGETHYNLWRMAIFATAGILSSSTLLLRLPGYLFPFWLVLLMGVGVAGIAGAAWAVPGVLVLGFGFCGFSLASLCIYSARIYKNGLLRPNFVVRKNESALQPTRERAANTYSRPEIRGREGRPELNN